MWIIARLLFSILLAISSRLKIGLLIADAPRTLGPPWLSSVN